MRLTAEDDDLHVADDDPNFNESRYYSFFDRGAGFGGWMRMGNRPNEGYAEMTVCLYLPDGRVGFTFGRPRIEGHTAHDAGGLRFEMVSPFREHCVRFEGDICLLAQPRDMVDPKSAFSDNPHEPCRIDLTLTGVAQPTGGEPEWEDGEVPESNGFARGHTEQQMAATGTVVVGAQRFELGPAYGLRDHSWGPRIWQSIAWYRWVTISCDRLGLACTLRGGDEPASRHVKGHVYDLDRYGDDRSVPVRSMELRSEYDGELFPVRNTAVITTDDHAYQVIGTIWSGIPLRNRRAGNVTRITENVTWWNCDGRSGAGMSEYLDQIVDGRPVGVDAGA